MKAMILAAGLGTRLRPITDKVPKALVRIGNYSMLELTIIFLKKYGINEIIINVHHFADQIIDYVKSNNSFGVSICFSDERNELLNTGGGLVKASGFLSDSNPFVLTSSDILTNLDLNDMIKYHKAQNNLVTLAVKDRKTTRSLLFDENMILNGWRDNNSGEIKMVSESQSIFSFGFSAVHVINPLVFKKITEQGAFSIIDLYLRLAAFERIGGYEHNKDEWLEFGRIDSIKKLEKSAEFNFLVSYMLSK